MGVKGELIDTDKWTDRLLACPNFAERGGGGSQGLSILRRILSVGTQASKAAGRWQQHQGLRSRRSATEA